MKNFLTAFIIIPGLLFFVACKKDNSALAPQSEKLVTQKVNKPSAPTRVKTEISNYASKTYYYNADLNSLGYTGSLSATYSYPDALHIIEAGTAVLETHYDLNKKGLIEKGINTNSDIYYLYNSKNQLTERFIQGHDGDIDVLIYIYKDGNLDSLKSFAGDILSSYQTFTYYTDKPNVLNNETFGEAFRGAESKNLLKSSTFHGFNDTQVRDYSYSFDALGRVTTKSNTINGNPEFNFAYTYY